MSSLSRTGSAYLGGSMRVGERRGTIKTDLAQTGSEDDDLVYLAHLLEEIVDTWTLQDMEMVPMVFDFDRDDEICLGNGLKRMV